MVAACAATGVKVTTEQANSFKAGVATYADVVAKLGPPTSRTTLPSGEILASYVYAEARARAANFVPIVGAFAGGYDSSRTMASFRFGADGRLISVTTSEGGTGTGKGLSAGVGTASSPTAAQPKQ